MAPNALKMSFIANYHFKDENKNILRFYDRCSYFFLFLRERIFRFGIIKKDTVYVFDTLWWGYHLSKYSGVMPHLSDGDDDDDNNDILI